MKDEDKIKEQFQSLVSNIPGIVYRCACDDNWTMQFISDSIDEISGYPPSDFIGNSVRTYESIIHSDDTQMVGKTALDAIERKVPFEIEYRLVNAEGAIRWVYEKGRGIYSDDGQVLWLDGAIFDITERMQNESELKKHRENLEKLVDGRTVELNVSNEKLMQEIADRKRNEEALRESEVRYRSLVSNIPGIVYRCACDEDWTMQYISDYIEETTGYPSSDFIDNKIRTFKSIMHPDDPQISDKIALEAIEQKEPFEIEYRIIHADGTIRWIYEKGRGVYSDAGQILYLDGVIFDNTERKRIEDALKKQTYDVSERNKELNCLYSTGKLIETPNISMDRVFQGIVDLMPPAWQYPEITCVSLSLNENEFKTKIFKKTDWVQCSDIIVYGLHVGRIDVYYLEEKPMLDEGPFMKEERNLINAITERLRKYIENNQTEENLHQSQKMESVGTLAGGVAHEFNNILGGITGYTEIAMDDAHEDSPVRESLDEILKLSNRARDVVKQILSFSRKGNKEFKPVQPHLIIEDSLNVLRATIPTTIEFKHNLDANSGTILADPTQINQVGTNLCMNAAHAMEDSGGVLEIGLFPVVLDAEDVKPYPDLETGEYVKLTISDTGSGIDPKNIDKIFDPFFTTKGIGKGTGMGLSVVHGIIKDHGGVITVSSKPGKGTTFTVFLPRIESKSEETKIEDAIPTGTENILVVDDEEHMVFLTKTILGRLGYKVTALTSSLEALELFKKDPQRYDLIITDLTMPHLTGDRLAAEITTIRPDMPVIIATGYADAIESEKVKQSGIKTFIPKPCQKRELAKTIRLILDEK